MPQPAALRYATVPREPYDKHFKGMFVILLLVVVIFLIIFNFLDWQRKEVHDVDLLRLLSYSNFYDDKFVCTRGYYVKTNSLSIIKVSIIEDEFKRSAWVKTLPGLEILKTTPAEPKKYIDASICGFFETGRAQAIGAPALWNHQLTAIKFETYGEAKTYKGTY